MLLRTFCWCWCSYDQDRRKHIRMIIYTQTRSDIYTNEQQTKDNNDKFVQMTTSVKRRILYLTDLNTKHVRTPLRHGTYYAHTLTKSGINTKLIAFYIDLGTLYPHLFLRQHVLTAISTVKKFHTNPQSTHPTLHYPYKIYFYIGIPYLYAHLLQGQEVSRILPTRLRSETWKKKTITYWWKLYLVHYSRSKCVYSPITFFQCRVPDKKAAGTIFKSLVWPGRDSNPRPADHAADALTTKPHDRLV